MGESNGDKNDCIHSHSREVNATSTLKVPLGAATVLELTGSQHLHGWMNHRFGESSKTHQLVARARQFSSFILVLGNMVDGSTLSPKDAIIVQNKDELLIPLLLEELPTAKEFKDAVKSLSPEQQRFARAYRSMQLSSSVFGICIVQIKPQLEALLGLPADSLDKEMKLTQDLMELFVEYQVPSDLLSYNGYSENAAVQDKISNVRDNVKGVLGVIEAEKEKQLKSEQAKTDMAMEQRFQSDMAEESLDSLGAFGGMMMPQMAPPPKSAPRSGRMKSDAPPQRQKNMMASRPASRPQMFAVNSMAHPPPPSTANFAAEAVVDASQSLPDFDQTAKQSDQPLNQEAERTGDKGGQPRVPAGEGVDFTLIPKVLDSAVEKSEQASALRSTTIKTASGWVRNRQDNLLSSPKKQKLVADDIKAEKNKAFDLLDALSRSGSLPIAYSELHVVVAVTHCFDRDVMSTVVCDNINPIEKLEGSTLLLASAVHGLPARDLIKDSSELQRLEGTLPLLLKQVENNNEGD